MSRSEVQRRGMISERLGGEHERAAADRRRQYDAFTHNKQANDQARQEFAEIAERQLRRGVPAVEVGDVPTQPRQRLNLVPQEPPGGDSIDRAEDRSIDPADADQVPARPARSHAKDVRVRRGEGGDPIASERRDDISRTRPSAKAALGQPAAAKRGEPAVGQRHDVTASSQPARQEAPANEQAPAGENERAAQSRAPERDDERTGGLFVLVEQPEEARPAQVVARPLEYLYGDHQGGMVFGDYLPSSHSRLITCAIVALVSIVLIKWLWETPQVRLYTGSLGMSSSADSSVVQPPVDQSGGHSLVGGPTITADVVDAVLAKYGSPAQGTGRIWVELGKRYGIDPAYALAFFIHESSAGTNPGWAGLKPGGGSTHNVGNIICAGYATCYGRFRDYGSWEEGIDDWYKLISSEYIASRGTSTVEQIIPIYAPASDNNDVPNYVRSVVDLVSGWRQGIIQ